jgi:hypothetical protein
MHFPVEHFGLLIAPGKQLHSFVVETLWLIPVSHFLFLSLWNLVDDHTVKGMFQTQTCQNPNLGFHPLVS